MLVVGSMRETDLPFQLATQSKRPPTATRAGRFPARIVAMTAFILGSSLKWYCFARSRHPNRPLADRHPKGILSHFPLFLFYTLRPARNGDLREEPFIFLARRDKSGTATGFDWTLGR